MTYNEWEHKTVRTHCDRGAAALMQWSGHVLSPSPPSLDPVRCVPCAQPAAQPRLVLTVSIATASPSPQPLLLWNHLQRGLPAIFEAEGLDDDDHDGHHHH